MMRRRSGDRVGFDPLRARHPNAPFATGKSPGPQQMRPSRAEGAGRRLILPRSIFPASLPGTISPMAAVDDFVLALSRGSITSAALVNLGLSGSAMDDFKRQVEQRHPNPTVPAAVATALGVPVAEIQSALTKRYTHACLKTARG